MATEQCKDFCVLPTPLYILWKLVMKNKQYGTNSLVVNKGRTTSEQSLSGSEFDKIQR
jgi:hypothetical protein